jgi:hypothetical protein
VVVHRIDGAAYDERLTWRRPTKVVSFAGYRWFESISLQRRVCLSRDFIFLGKNPGFPRGFPGCVPGAVDRETQGPPIARQPGAVSLSGHIPVPRFRQCGRDKSLS